MGKIIYLQGGGILLPVACMLTLDVETIRRWARFMWDLKGSLNVVWLGKKYFILKFEVLGRWSGSFNLIEGVLEGICFI